MKCCCCKHLFINEVTDLYSSLGGSDCIKANAKSCGECIQAGPNCGWCKKTVSVAKIFLWFGFFPWFQTLVNTLPVWTGLFSLIVVSSSSSIRYLFVLRKIKYYDFSDLSINVFRNVFTSPFINPKCIQTLYRLSDSYLKLLQCGLCLSMLNCILPVTLE